MVAEHTEDPKRLQLPEKLILPDQKLLQSKNSSNEHKHHTGRKRSEKGCPQGSCCGPGYWNIQYNSLLNLEFMKQTKAIAFADDLLIAVKAYEKQEIY